MSEEAEKKGCLPLRERPQTWSELRDFAKDIAATEKVPEHLRPLWLDLSANRPMELHAVSKEAHGRETRLEPLAGYRPSWVGYNVKPLQPTRRSRPMLQHRGVQVTPLVIWGADDRRIYNDTSYPWGCVCRVISAGSGSGVLVGPRHVLTASHCIDWGTNGSGIVEVHRNGSSVAAIANIVKVYYFTKVTEGEYSTLDEDYALIVLDQRLGDRFGWMGVRTYDSDWDDEDLWHNIGYPADIGGGMNPIWQRNKELDEDEWDYGSARAMTTAADIVKGQSGSPMFSFWDDGPYVVAIAVAEGNVFASGMENWCAGGSDLTRLVRYGREQEP